MSDAADRICFWSRIARRKLNVGDDWRWCNLRAVGPDATQVDGGVPRILKSGPRKGKTTWSGCELQTCIVTDREMDEERASYEQTTGNCWECCGSKQVVRSVSSAEGTKYRECARCRGTGAAP